MDISGDSSTDLTQQDKEQYITQLDNSYTSDIPLAYLVQEMTDAGLTKIQRNELILKSRYAKDELIRDTIILFGGT